MEFWRIEKISTSALSNQDNGLGPLRSRFTELPGNAPLSYLIVRYAPELTSTLSQVNRVMTTLEEVSRKVPKMLKATKPHK